MKASAVCAAGGGVDLAAFGVMLIAAKRCASEATKEIPTLPRGPVTPYIPTPAEQIAALADVAYEIEQIVQLRSARPQEAGPLQNAWLEAMLIHARALLDFFERPCRSVSRDHENDDILAVDYGFKAHPMTIGATFRERLNKDLAHLSYSRQKRAGSAKRWHLTTLCPLITRSHQFAAHILATRGSDLTPAEGERWASLRRDLSRMRRQRRRRPRHAPGGRHRRLFRRNRALAVFG